MSRILLGMSGGIDSSVAAWILTRDVHEVVGVTLRFHDSPIRSMAIERARETAEKLGIEYHVVDLHEKFAETIKKVTERKFAQGYFVNPCTLCTHEMKIPALFKQAEVFGCDKVATGHYARITHEEEGFELKPYQLRKPLDKFKDQTYFLYTLTQDEMAHLVFPLEDLHKGEVRRLAMQQGLMRVAPVNDGQGIPCFYNGFDHVNWLETGLGVEEDEGDVIYLGDNSKVGTYRGQYRYAPDESIGTFDGEELFVIYKDPANKRIYANTRSLAGTEMCVLRDVCWTSIEAPEQKRSCRARISFDSKPKPAQVIVKEEGIVVAFNERVLGVCPGEPIVLYSDDLVLGGGIVAG